MRLQLDFSIPHKNPNQLHKEDVESKNYKKNITWPFWEYSTSIVSFTDELENLIISENDRHPSAAGQQYIADTFLTHYKTM